MTSDALAQQAGAALRLDHVVPAYGDVHAVKGISLDVAPTLQLIAGFQTPTCPPTPRMRVAFADRDRRPRRCRRQIAANCIAASLTHKLYVLYNLWRGKQLETREFEPVLTTMCRAGLR
jgi:hypothetical protein